MLFKVVPLFLLASTVLAVPSRLGSRIARRRANRQSQPLNRLDGSISNEQYAANWAGAVLTEDDNTFTTVTGTFTVPTPSGNDGDSASAWVGIDGCTCTSAILQTGIDFTVSSDGPTYDVWYEFFPAPSGDFSSSDITINPGDVIRLTVTAYSLTSGTVMVENLSSCQTVSMDLTTPPSSPLCGQNAEWIVEDYVVDSSLVPFANFGTVTFTDASAGSYVPGDGGIIDIRQNGQVLTASSVSGSSANIQYVGN